MQILDDFNKLYSKAREFAIGYFVGHCIGITLTFIVLVMLLSGWSPIPKRISEAKKPPLPTSYGVQLSDGQGGWCYADGKGGTFKK
jgi:hypothetical protein